MSRREMFASGVGCVLGLLVLNGRPMVMAAATPHSPAESIGEDRGLMDFSRSSEGMFSTWGSMVSRFMRNSVSDSRNNFWSKYNSLHTDVYDSVDPNQLGDTRVHHSAIDFDGNTGFRPMSGDGYSMSIFLDLVLLRNSSDFVYEYSEEGVINKERSGHTSFDTSTFSIGLGIYTEFFDSYHGNGGDRYSLSFLLSLNRMGTSYGVFHEKDRKLNTLTAGFGTRARVRVIGNFNIFASAAYGRNFSNKNSNNTSNSLELLENKNPRDFDWSAGVNYEFWISNNFILKPSLCFNRVLSDITSFQQEGSDAYKRLDFLKWKIDGVFRISNVLDGFITIGYNRVIRATKLVSLDQRHVSVPTSQWEYSSFYAKNDRGDTLEFGFGVDYETDAQKKGSHTTAIRYIMGGNGASGISEVFKEGTESFGKLEVFYSFHF